MWLNLSVIADYIKNVTILQQKLDSQSGFFLRYPVHYQEGDIFKNDRLYVTGAERLPTEPMIDTSCSIISIGYPPLSYNRDDVEMLCLSGEAGLENVIQEVLEVFDMFYGFEARMNDVLLQSDPFSALGEILFDIFKAPMQAMTCFDKILFTVYDPAQPKFRERYQQYASSAYVPLEERFIIGADPGFSQIYSRRGAFYCTESIPVYGVPVVMYNLYDEDMDYGYVYMEEAYRKIRSSDYRLLEWAGGYIIRLLKKSRSALVKCPDDIHRMITPLITNHFPYKKENDRILSRKNWKKTDPYLCLCALCEEADGHESILINGAVALTAMDKDQLTVLEDQTIIQIINLRTTSLDTAKIMAHLDLMTSNSPISVGISEQFDRFENVHIYYRQAFSAAQNILDRQDVHIGIFGRMLPEMLMDRIFRDEEPQYFFTHQLQRLIDYDHAKNTELIKTLKVYLEQNKNTTHTQELLHISRAACIYRIRRIEEISGMDLDDLDTVIYLLLILRRGIVS